MLIVSSWRSREIVVEAIKKRLEYISPYVLAGKWKEAMALATLPANIPASLKHLYLLVDEICYLAKQKDHDVMNS